MADFNNIDLSLQDLNGFDQSTIKQILDKKIGYTWSSASWSFLSVENPYFLNLVQTLLSIDPKKVSYTPPSRKTLSSVIMPAIQTELESVKKNLLKEQTPA